MGQADIQNLMNNGMSGVLVVSQVGKLTTTWSSIKTK